MLHIRDFSHLHANNSDDHLITVPTTDDTPTFAGRPLYTLSRDYGVHCIWVKNLGSISYFGKQWKCEQWQLMLGIVRSAPLDVPMNLLVLCVCYNCFTCFDFDSNGHERREKHETFSQRSVAIMWSDELISHRDWNDEDVSTLQVMIVLIIQYSAESARIWRTSRHRYAVHTIIWRTKIRKKGIRPQPNGQLFAARKFFIFEHSVMGRLSMVAPKAVCVHFFPSGGLALGLAPDNKLFRVHNTNVFADNSINFERESWSRCTCCDIVTKASYARTSGRQFHTLISCSAHCFFLFLLLFARRSLSAQNNSKYFIQLSTKVWPKEANLRTKWKAEREQQKNTIEITKWY